MFAMCRGKSLESLRTQVDKPSKLAETFAASSEPITPGDVLYLILVIELSGLAGRPCAVMATLCSMLGDDLFIECSFC